MSIKKSLPFKFFVYIWELKSVNVKKKKKVLMSQKVEIIILQMWDFKKCLSV